MEVLSLQVPDFLFKARVIYTSLELNMKYGCLKPILVGTPQAIWDSGPRTWKFTPAAGCSPSLEEVEWLQDNRQGCLWKSGEHHMERWPGFPPDDLNQDIWEENPEPGLESRPLAK